MIKIVITRVDWKRILLELRDNNYPTAKVARELDLPTSSIQNMMSGHEPGYSLGKAVIELHKLNCQAKSS